MQAVDRGKFDGLGMQTQVEGIEVVAGERGHQDAAKLRVIGGDFQFFRGPADGEVVDQNLALHGAVGHAPQFAKLQIAEMLHADPYSGAKHSQYQAQHIATGHSRNRLSRANRAETA